MDIWEYFLQKEREFSDAGCVPEEPLSDVFQADPYSDGTRGRVRATLRLMDKAPDAHVEVYERVVVVDNHRTREAYSYPCASENGGYGFAGPILTRSSTRGPLSARMLSRYPRRRLTRTA